MRPARRVGEKVSGILKSRATRKEFLSDTRHRIRFVCLPKHSSWLNQIEIIFGIIHRKCLRGGSFTSVANQRVRRDHGDETGVGPPPRVSASCLRQLNSRARRELAMAELDSELRQTLTTSAGTADHSNTASSGGSRTSQPTVHRSMSLVLCGIDVLTSSDRSCRHRFVISS